MSRLDKGLLFFYDWEECFDSLPDKEFKEMVMAMLRYKKYGTPPPEFNGISKIAASLIFPQLDRQIRDFENGKKGGRPKKEDTDLNNITNKEEDLPPSSSTQVSEWDELISRAAKKSAVLRREREERANKRSAEQ